MRQGELLALRWADLDFAGRFISVNRHLVQGLITTPKNQPPAVRCRIADSA